MPNPYSNRFDFMSSLSETNWWRQTLPTTLAINRYATGWIRPDEVALHLTESGTYTLRKPFQGGKQFLVVHSGRRYAFTTLEIPDGCDSDYLQNSAIVYDPDAPNGWRPFRYEGVLAIRYDQTTGTGVNVRSGPAVYDTGNPDYRRDVGWGRDDHALIPDGESRDLGGVIASVKHTPDGSYDIALEGVRTAQFEAWCIPRFGLEFDTGCNFDDPR